MEADAATSNVRVLQGAPDDAIVIAENCMEVVAYGSGGGKLLPRADGLSACRRVGLLRSGTYVTKVARVGIADLATASDRLGCERHRLDFIASRVGQRWGQLDDEHRGVASDRVGGAVRRQFVEPGGVWVVPVDLAKLIGRKAALGLCTPVGVGLEFGRVSTYKFADQEGGGRMHLFLSLLSFPPGRLEAGGGPQSTPRIF